MRKKHTLPHFSSLYFFLFLFWRVLSGTFFPPLKKLQRTPTSIAVQHSKSTEEAKVKDYYYLLFFWPLHWKGNIYLTMFVFLMNNLFGINFSIYH